MLIGIAIVLFVVWILGFTVAHVASAAIHILPLLALVAVVVFFVRRGSSGGTRAA
jgi:Family of unknown function (DUF5670)